MPAVSQNMVHGVQPVLEALRIMDRELYKGVQKDLKDKTDDLRVAVAGAFPEKPWQSDSPVNWTKYGRTQRGRRPKNATGATFPRWQAGKVKSGVRIVVGGRKVRRTNSYPILRVGQYDAAGAVYDLAKNARTQAGATFVRNLASEGTPSRVMWKQVRANYPLIEGKVQAAINGLMRQFSAQIAYESDKRAMQSMRAAQQSRNALGQFGKAVR